MQWKKQNWTELGNRFTHTDTCYNRGDTAELWGTGTTSVNCAGKTNDPNLGSMEREKINLTISS